MKAFLEKHLLSIWYGEQNELDAFDRVLGFLLRPLSLLTQAVVSKKYKKRKKCQFNPDGAPVVVVGNLSVGGTGKSPLIYYLAQSFSAKGIQVGIVSRGYGGNSGAEPVEVFEDSDPDQVGDEPLMLWKRLNHKSDIAVPIVVCADRTRAVAMLDKVYQPEIIFSDDGLQHYAMARSLEILVVDGIRGLGNGKLIPAGPLREPLSRLQSVDFVLINGARRHADKLRFIDSIPQGTHFTVKADTYRPLNTLAKTSAYLQINEQNSSSGTLSLEGLITAKLTSQPSNDKTPLQLLLLAGIGNPQRFFRSVESELKNISRIKDYPSVQHYSFPDHHDFGLRDFQPLALTSNSIIIITAKDAVKCESFADQIPAAVYVAEANVVMDSGAEDMLDSIQQLIDNARVQRQNAI